MLVEREQPDSAATCQGRNGGYSQSRRNEWSFQRKDCIEVAVPSFPMSGLMEGLMGRVGYSLTGALLVCSAMAVLLPSESMADALTRSGCWSFLGDKGDKRTLCFFAPPRVTMTNYNFTVSGGANGRGWSTCEWTGNYSQSGTTITLTFAQNSGTCSNGASSPQTTAVCDFSGESLECHGNTIIAGKAYAINLIFK
jgi:hypothetical protein